MGLDFLKERHAMEETIAAIATPLGEGGIAVIRVSGPRALEVVDQCFEPGGKRSCQPSRALSHTIQYGRMVRRGAVVDEVLVAIMRAPRTFTREDVVEISCHGGLLTAKQVLDTVLEHGARLAHPGEFTRRAFLNGRIDLAQAEAVADLIHARTDLAMKAAQEQLSGHLSRRIDQVRGELMLTLAHVEAHIDFPDEDIEPATMDQLMNRLTGAVAFMDELLATAQEGRLLRRGIRAAIIGRPNAGKSSLLNRLLGHDRAIVSEVPGTTRDTIEETANVRGIPVVFVDTAGLRESNDTVEQEGIRRSQRAFEQSDLILHVLDLSEPLTAEDHAQLEALANRKRVLVANKSDMPPRWRIEELKESSPLFLVSCKTGDGLGTLRDGIKNLFWSGAISNEMLEVMINSRHQDALRRGREATAQALECLREGLTLELAAMELHVATRAVGEIVGKTTTEDLLDAIFSQFCLGK